MTAAAKFLFDTDFGNGAHGKPVITLADHQARLAQAEATAYADGFSAAEAKLQATSASSLQAALGRIADGLDQLIRRFDVLETRLETEAVEIAAAVAGKLAPELMAREPLAEIAALVGECLRNLAGVPHLAVRINDALYEDARSCLAGLARDRGFEGRLVVLAEPDIALGDCRIEWADGGLTRERAATEAAIAELIDRYLAARRADTTMAAPGGASGSAHS